MINFLGDVTGDQIRAARAMLRWSARVLAEKAGVHVITVQRMEAGRGPVHGNVDTLRKVQLVLERAGIEFINGDAPGVRRRDRPTGGG